MSKRWPLILVGAMLLGAFILGGCGLTRWAIRKWGEPQYMSYRIDGRNLSLYTYPRQEFDYTAEGIDAALGLAGGRAASAGRPLVIFLHGRGKHPEKAFADDPEIGQGILGQMVSHYQVELLMLHWPSWLDVSGYPSLNAQETGPHLQLLFQRIGHYRTIQRHATAQPVNLFVHSMGNQVLASYIENYSGEFGRGVPLFDTLILNAPDADLKDHRLWVERIDFAGRIYILLNTGKDRLLQLSTYLLNTPRLGRQLIHEDDRPEPLAQNAAYVDLVQLGVNHDYFYGEALPPNLVELYRRFFWGVTDPLETPGMKVGNLDRLYSLWPLD
jgi:esterase/lipase superfamily enzyme